jgi:GTP cyclohydrolase IA
MSRDGTISVTRQDGTASNGTVSRNGTVHRTDLPPLAADQALPSVSPTLQRTAHDLLVGIGEDPDRVGLRETPRRVAESLAFLTAGYHLDPHAVVGAALFPECFDDMVVVRDIEFYSLCEHHLLPFFGTVHIGYLPNGRIVGLSKLPRLVEVFVRQLQVQERLTREIAECLHELLAPIGLGVVIEASHLCMMMRGVQKQQSTTVTNCVLGAFRDNATTRAEFMALVRRDGAGRHA